MEPKLDVLATLEAKSKQTSLEDLAKGGRSKVRVIKAKDVAWMMQQAVERALQATDWVPPDQVDEIKRTAASEFKELRKEREAERRLLDELTQERDELQQTTELLRERAEELLRENRAAAETEEALETSRSRVAELERELDTLREEAREQQNLIESLKKKAAEPPPPAEFPAAGGDTATAMLMMRMMDEIQSLKSHASAAPQPAPAANDSAVTDQLAKIMGSLNDRLEKMGKKMGISAAVESEVNYEGLVSHAMSGEDLESNMDTVDVEKREGAGIAANLERMRKLKGGG